MPDVARRFRSHTASASRKRTHVPRSRSLALVSPQGSGAHIDWCAHDPQSTATTNVPVSGIAPPPYICYLSRLASPKPQKLKSKSSPQPHQDPRLAKTHHMRHGSGPSALQRTGPAEFVAGRKTLKISKTQNACIWDRARTPHSAPSTFHAQLVRTVICLACLTSWAHKTHATPLAHQIARAL